MSEKDVGGSDEGQGEIPDDGFAGELAKAWDKADTEEAVSAEAEPETGWRRDERGRFAAKAEPEPEPVGATGPSTAPEHWSQDDRDAFSALPEEIKPLYLEKVKRLESGWNRKYEELADVRKQAEELSATLGTHDAESLHQLFQEAQAFRGIFEPYQQQLRDANVSVADYVGRLVNVAQRLDANPEGTLRFLAEQYGVDLGAQAGPNLDHEHEQEIARYRQMMEEVHAKEWSAFVSANPQAAPLRQRIGLELSLRPPQPGESAHQSLDRAFESVKWADPEIRQSLLDVDRKAQQAERQRKADLAKAKKAGRTVKSKSAPVGDERVPGKSWKDELEQQWDQANA